MMNLTLLQHAGNPNMCRVPELKIRQVPECEGGGWWIPREQAEFLVEAARIVSGDLTDRMQDAGFAAIAEYEAMIAAKVSPRPTLTAHIFRKMLTAGDRTAPAKTETGA